MQPIWTKTTPVYSTFLWRGECLKPVSGLPDEVATTARLRIALERQRVGREAYETLREVLQRFFLNKDPLSSALPQFIEPHASLMYRAGILQRDFSTRRSMLAWFAAHIALTVAFSLLGYKLGIPGGDDAMGYVLLIGSAALSLLVLRPFYNRRYKGEWLPDEALALARWVISGILVAGLLALPIMALWGERGAFREWSIVLVVSAGCVIFLQLLLWLFGRAPYRKLTYGWGIYW